MSTQPPSSPAPHPARSDARAWIEVDAGALGRNLDRIRAALPTGTGLIPMVKADGYGLGVAPLVERLESAEPRAYGVATVDEGMELRDFGVRRPILVFSPVPPGDEDAVVEAELTLCLSDRAALGRLREVARRERRLVPVHLEIDTGMGRAGFRSDALDDWGPAVREAVAADSGADGGVALEGLFTHFHSADESPERAQETIAAQRERFGRVSAAIEEWVPGPLLVHLSNSAASLRTGAAGGTAVRPGIFLYGGGVGEEVEPPEDVVSVRARVIRVVDVPAGATVGYGATYRAGAPERWATLAIGYGDGLPRALSNRGRVVLQERSAPIVGRISMDMTVVDITGVPSTRPGDVATIVGRRDRGEPTLDEVATGAGTISYEILTGLSPRLPRRWLRDP